MSALLLLLLTPLFTGSLKWLKARLQNRRGPDPLYDYKNLFKLWRKTWIRPQGSSPLFLLAPVASLLGVGLAAAFLPVLPGISFAGDFLVLIYLITGASHNTAWARQRSGLAAMRFTATMR